jgi:hypothetical protein
MRKKGRKSVIVVIGSVVTLQSTDFGLRLLTVVAHKTQVHKKQIKRTKASKKDKSK